MNLERLLAKNMIRFKVKNLNEQQIKRLITEQTLSVIANGTKSPVPVINEFVNSMDNWGSKFTEAHRNAVNYFNNNKIPFNNISTAATWFVLCLILPEGKSGSIPRASLKDVTSFINYIETRDPVGDTRGWSNMEIQLNKAPENNSILTVGTITPTVVQGSDPGAYSDLNDIVLFCNNYNIQQIAKAIGVDIGFDLLNIEPYRADAQIAKNQILGGTFTQGEVGQPGVGSLDLPESIRYFGGLICYSTAKFEAASAKSTGKQITIIDKTPGPTVPINATDTFEKAGIKLSDIGKNQIKAAMDEIKNLGTILSVNIKSAASFDEPVKSDTRQKFADQVGLPVNEVPEKPQQDKLGTVTDPMYGGNSFLAYKRGQALLEYVKQLLPGITPKVESVVEKGEAAARYAKIFVEVKKSDGTTEITRDDLNKLEAGAKTTDVAGIYKIYKHFIGV